MPATVLSHYSMYNLQGVPRRSSEVQRQLSANIVAPLVGAIAQAGHQTLDSIRA